MVIAIARLAACIVPALVLSSAFAADRPPPADLVVTDARIYTADTARSMAEAIAVRDGRIVFVGDASGAGAFIGPETKVRALAGRLVLPGLIDSHIHPTVILDQPDACDLKTQPMSLQAISEFVRGCIERQKVPAGEWVNVRMWNFSNGNEPDALHPTFRRALDRASTRHPIQLFGADGHHLGFNSVALAGAKNEAGRVVGVTKATLAGDFQNMRHLFGVDESGEPNGTANDNARYVVGAPGLLEIEVAENMKSPERMPQLLNSSGITGVLDAAVTPELLPFYDTLDARGQLTVRATLAQFYEPEAMLAPNGQPDFDRMVATAKAVRSKYANNPLLRADRIKLFADGTLEGDPRAIPPTLPVAAGLRPYLQPIFENKGGKVAVVGYVDPLSAVCQEVRGSRERYEAAAAVSQFVAAQGFHPDQCRIASGALQHDRAVILEFVKRFHLAGFPLHIHAISDAAIRTALDAIEAARAADGVTSQQDALAHIQVVHPDDAARIGRLRLYLAFTYSWAYSDPEYDLSVVPFYDRVIGGDDAALHPQDGYYEQNGYPARRLKDAGGILLAGSDAPVFTRDPQPFVNMAMAVTRRLRDRPPFNTRQSVSIREVLDAYTINGARYLDWDSEAGSLEVGKSADFIVVDRDILALADGGNPDAVRDTNVLETWFRGKSVYVREGDPDPGRAPHGG